MKNLIFLSILLIPVFASAQTYSTAELSKKMRAVEAKNVTQDATIKKLVADTLLKSKQIKALNDTIRIYSRILSLTDFNVDTKGNVTIPQLKTLDTRLKKLEDGIYIIDRIEKPETEQ